MCRCNKTHSKEATLLVDAAVQCQMDQLAVVYCSTFGNQPSLLKTGGSAWFQKHCNKSWIIVDNYKKYILHDVIMHIKNLDLYIIHKISTLYCRIGNDKSFFTSQVLYFSKYWHPQKWHLFALLPNYQSLQTKSRLNSPTIQLDFTLFCSLCFRQIKT